jgi:hypothetical protein
LIVRVFLRIPIAVGGRGLGAKFFSAKHAKNSYPTHHKKNLGVSHDVIPHLMARFKCLTASQALPR